MRFLILSALFLSSAAQAKDLETYIERADGKTATVYGFGEKMCGDVGKARRCSKGAVTASGQPFDPAMPTAAIAIPAKYKMPPEGMKVGLMFEGGQCTEILINDKKHPRFMNSKPIDLSVGAVRAMGGNPTKRFSDKVFLCEMEEIEVPPKMIEMFYETIIEISDTII